MIPKKIHYCWFGGKPLPKNVLQCIESWKKFCPDYEIIRWDESNFDITCSKFVEEAYEEKAWAFVSDYARLKVIYESGGIYLDTDVELIKNLDELLNNQFYIGIQQVQTLCNTGLGFGATRSNPVVKEMLSEYDNLNFENSKKESLACPYLNSKVLTKRGYKFTGRVQYITGGTIYPPMYFDPMAPGDGTKNLLCEETVSIHHYSASWLDKKIQLKRKIIRMIGQDKVSKFKMVFKNGK
ncbi:glycosyltransferase family 32 protein [Gorillibacterium sp. sgz500922]|uniref:glycosyltransferase family 32 protein n=1 Tax=Gorillibacterium sp. sgz500922 TaxID=3446694 RepID=UPI003F666A75